MNKEYNIFFYKAENYLKNIKIPENFKQTGINKNLYLDIMELSANAYSKDDLQKRLEVYKENAIDDIQAFTRITSIIGILIANGRKQDYRQLWNDMMDVCCRDISTCGKSDVRDFMPDFSVKELMLVYKTMKPFLDESQKQRLKEGLRKVEPYKVYGCTIQKLSNDEMNNISVYNLAGEFLRETEGLTDCNEYFEQHWPIQLEKFDQNSMYLEPHYPLLYDITTRVQMQYITGFGYKGRYHDVLDNLLKEGAFSTLFSQSSAFVFPYGGRSNQYQFNEALIASCCEYEATRYKKLGLYKIAGAYKRSAHLAALSILRWVKDVNPPRHIKNFYPIETKYGTESYGYYDKYMATLGSFIYPAFLFADESIAEVPCPAEQGGFVYETSDKFKKIFANCCGHSIEIDLLGTSGYDAIGLGRYHRSGFPIELGLSLPFTKSPTYVVDTNAFNESISICAGWDDGNGNIQFLSQIDSNLTYLLKVFEEKQDNVSFSIEYSGDGFNGCKGVSEHYTLNAQGVEIVSELIEPLIDKIYYQVPLFFTNGKDFSNIEISKNSASVKLQEYIYKVSSDGDFFIGNKLLPNRNGKYKRALIQNDGIRLNLKLYLHSEN